jgi:hypothetical protein
MGGSPPGTNNSRKTTQRGIAATKVIGEKYIK